MVRIVVALYVFLSVCPTAVGQPAQTLVIENVRVLDADSGQLSNRVDVDVTNGLISAVGKSTHSPSGDIRRIDGQGGILLPGLIDMHAHLSMSPLPPWMGRKVDREWSAQAYLRSGVTTIFEVMAPASAVGEVRAGKGDGHLRPHILTSGPPITVPGGHPLAVASAALPRWLHWYFLPKIAKSIASTQEAVKAVSELSELGVDHIKIVVDDLPPGVPKMAPSLMRSVVDEAHRRRLRVVTHIGTIQDALETAKAGVDLWVHGPYKGPVSDEAINELAAFRIPMVPTVWIFQSHGQSGPREYTALERRLISPDVLDAWNNPPKGHTFRNHAFASSITVDGNETIRRLQRAGVTILAGSDPGRRVFPGAGLHRELRALQAAGLTSAQVIRSATSDAARWLDRSADPSFGIVAAGKRADLLLVNCDPLQDLACLSDIRAVFVAGRVHHERQ